MIQMLGVTSLVFVIITLVLFVALHLVARQYSILGHAVSDYAIGTSAKLFVLYIASSQIACVVLAIGIISSSFQVLSVKTVIALLLVVVFRIGLAIFKTNIEGERISTIGYVHYFFAVLSFAALFIVVDSSVTDLSKLGRMSGIRQFTVGFEITFGVFLASVCLTLIPALRRVFGLFERAYLVLGNIWIAALSFAIIGIK
jgi:hypothetical protein